MPFCEQSKNPKVNCVFVLFATSVDDVLPTVVSRCQVLPFQTTDSTGLSMRGNDLSGFEPETVRMAKEAIDKYMRRHDSKSLSQVLQFNRELVDAIGHDFSPHEAVDLLVGIELQRVDKSLIQRCLERLRQESDSFFRAH